MHSLSPTSFSCPPPPVARAESVFEIPSHVPQHDPFTSALVFQRSVLHEMKRIKQHEMKECGLREGVNYHELCKGLALRYFEFLRVYKKAME